jgi:membrane-associated HD superfamily phosphohydrolase
MMSGFCFLYSLFFPFNEVIGDKPEIEVIYGYEFMTDVILRTMNSVLNSSIVDVPIQYAIDYLILIILILMLFSIVVLLWTSIRANIIISNITSISYFIFSLFIIVFIIDYSAISTLRAGYYMFIGSSVSAILVPIFYRLYR